MCTYSGIHHADICTRTLGTNICANTLLLALTEHIVTTDTHLMHTTNI